MVLYTRLRSTERVKNRSCTTGVLVDTSKELLEEVLMSKALESIVWQAQGFFFLLLLLLTGKLE